ncbi:MAG: hypothetical protein KUG80_08205 [Gammaproteobacteria bacterium]|nr:hypothetical protein [Gammaproteobacteria bacterium]
MTGLSVVENKAINFSLEVVLFEWMVLNEDVLFWLGMISLFSFVGSIILLPVLIIRLPEDYFLTEQRHSVSVFHENALVHYCIKILKNLVGLIVILCGVAMLVLPGQGVMTILLGVLMIDFPRKFQLERYLLGRKGLLNSLNWIREQANKPKLKINR